MDYSDVDPKSLILRDHLAFERTMLANERTMLAYIRSALGMAAGGVTLLQVFPDTSWGAPGGMGLLVGSILCLAAGGIRFWVTRRRLRTVQEAPKGS